MKVAAALPGQLTALEVRSDARAFVRRGNSLLVLAKDQRDVDVLNRIFGWQMKVAEALPGLDEDQAATSYRTTDKELLHRFGNCMLLNHRAKIDPDDKFNAVSFEATSLPAQARVLYNSSLVQAFTVPVGEGRIGYCGYTGFSHTTTANDGSTLWRTVIHRLIRGQTKFDV